MKLKEGIGKDLLFYFLFEPINAFFGVLGLTFFLLVFAIPTWYIILCIPISTIAYVYMHVDKERGKRIFRKSWVE